MQILLSDLHRIIQLSKESATNLVNSDVIRACCVVDAAISNIAMFELLQDESDKSSFAMAFVARCAIYVLLEDTDDEGTFQTSAFEHYVTTADISSWADVQSSMNITLVPKF